MSFVRLLEKLLYLCGVINIKENMKFTRTLLIASVAALVFASCGEKKQSNDIITKKPEVKAPSQPVRMQDYSHKEEVEWLGGQYVVDIKRSADKSMPVISDDAGGRYYDNTITVKVTRPDGTEFFNRTFTKADFKAEAGSEYVEKNALLGRVFDRVDGDYLVFAASVGAPDVLSDDYVPMLLKLSRLGAVSIEKDTRLDGDVEE